LSYARLFICEAQ